MTNEIRISNTEIRKNSEWRNPKLEDRRERKKIYENILSATRIGWFHAGRAHGRAGGHWDNGCRYHPVVHGHAARRNSLDGQSQYRGNGIGAGTAFLQQRELT